MHIYINNLFNILESFHKLLTQYVGTQPNLTAQIFPRDILMEQ